MIKLTLAEKGYNLSWGHPLTYVVVPFQTFNEELVFRALILNGLLKIGFRKWQIILVPAFLFTVFHWIFYHFNIVPENRGDIEITALVTLFLFGMTTNAIFLKTKNIAMPWALHCGWNFNRFGGVITSLNGHEYQVIREYMSFNLLEGSWLITVLSFCMTLMSLVFLLKKS